MAMKILICIIAVLVFLKIFSKLTCFWCRSKVCLIGKTAIVTGGASGLGYQTALTLASKGCRVIIADVANISEAVEKIKKRTQNPLVLGLKLDLESFKSVREFAQKIIKTEERLDILVCNAGIGEHRKRIITGDGLERLLQINYFSHFLLTHLLLDLLKKTAPSRIVYTSSLYAFLANLPLDQLIPDPEYFESIYTRINSGTYSASKLYMAGAIKVFGEKLNGTGVTANASLPNVVKTPIFWKAVIKDENLLAIIALVLCFLYGKTPEEGAQTLIHLAHSDEIKDVTGQAFVEGRVWWHPSVLTDDYCKKLWHESIRLTKLQPDEIKC